MKQGPGYVITAAEAAPPDYLEDELMQAIYFILLGALLNRASGMDRWFPGRNIYAVSLILFAIGWATLGLGWGVALFLSSLCFRLPGWWDAIDMGMNEGTVLKDFGIMWFRGTFMVPVYYYAVFWAGTHTTLAAVALIVSSFLFAMAYLVDIYGRHIHRQPVGLLSELLGGAAVGFGVSLLV